MYKYLEINSIQIYRSLLLRTLNVPIQMANIPLGVLVDYPG